MTTATPVPRIPASMLPFVRERWTMLTNLAIARREQESSARQVAWTTLWLAIEMALIVELGEDIGTTLAAEIAVEPPDWFVAAGNQHLLYVYGGGDSDDDGPFVVAYFRRCDGVWQRDHVTDKSWPCRPPEGRAVHLAGPG